MSNCDLLHLVTILLNCLDGDNLVSEKALLLGSGSLLVTLNSESVLLFSSYSEHFSDVLRGLSHRNEAVSGLWVIEDAICKELRVHGTLHIIHCHLFNTSTDTKVDLASFDFSSDGGAGFKSRRAESIDSVERNGVW